MTDPVLVPPIFSTADEALAEAARDVLAQAELVAPRGALTREVIGYSFRLSDPRARMIGSPARQWSAALAVGELCWHLGSSDDLEQLAYYAKRWRDFSEDGRRLIGSCYGKRIFGLTAAGVSQWTIVRDLLTTDPDTRRAVLLLADPRADSVSAADVACMTSIQFLLRGGDLHAITTMRSNDLIWGFPYDLFLATMLQELMAVRLGVGLGWYQHTAASLHVYEPFFARAQAIAQEGGHFAPEPMAAMTHPEAIPEFLEVERNLRLRRPEGEASLNHLPDYWRWLSGPLVDWARREELGPS